MQQPDWSRREANQIEPVDQIAHIDQHQVQTAVGAQISGLVGAAQHRYVAAGKDKARDGSGHQGKLLGVHSLFLVN